ncbi:hypothetical protein MKW98_029418 [Papaver atlanticum]|uniref:ABC transporter B family member 8 n=1 Tax=Papaver atlanticum TaxID=357466 RepID=A0AAD4SHU6_9MAGN|nr:hypothetical protein MKW98_029418 [Papaver atlanticum]
MVDKKSILVIFRYSNRLDVLLMLLGSVGAIGDGMAINLFLVFASHLLNTLGHGKSKDDQGHFMNEVEKSILHFCYVGLAVTVAAFMEGYCWSWTGERQVRRIRHKYLEAILRQEVGFFDSQEATTSEIINSISKDTSLIQEVLSEKVPLVLMHTFTFVSGLALSVYLSWRLFVVVFPLVILLLIPGIIYAKYLLHLSKKSSKEYDRANTIIREALGSIKTIYSLTIERMIVTRYSEMLNTTLKIGLKQGLAKGLAVGSNGLAFLIWAFIAWYGSQLIMHKGESGGNIHAAGLCFIIGGRTLGVAFPEIKYITKASIAAARIFERIDRVPKIEENPQCLALDELHGELEFEHVNFAYPSRPDTFVLRDFNLKVEAGQTIALVGASGCGKSTVIALLQRFYDSDSGVIRIDGVDIKTLQLNWMRAKMGLVNQEHALFGTSIKENMLFGKPDATMDEIVAASVAANAHKFIRQLPEGYDTKVGEHGDLLSGGQKQRIAIARAIIKNPAILLLDEATSALDSESEALVQNALEQASIGRTTLVVAHKLITIEKADQIAVVDGGRIIEMESHRNLIRSENGHYAKLAKLQSKFGIYNKEHLLQSSIPSTPINKNRLSIERSSPISSFASSLPIEDSSIIKPSYHPPSFSRLLALNYPEWKQGLIGGISTIIFGTIQPISALTVGSMISAFFTQNHDEMKVRIQTFSLIFALLAVVSIILSVIQHYSFAYMGEHLTRRIRMIMLEKILSFETAWFDKEENSSGALCSRLSNQASMVKSLVADRMSLLLQSFSAVIAAAIMSLIISWKFALVIIALQPLAIFSIYTQKVLLSSVNLSIVNAQHMSTQTAVEAVCNHRIVTSFGSVAKVLQLFDNAQDKSRKEASKKSLYAGIGMASALCASFMSWAFEYWYGGKLVDLGQIPAADVFKIFIIWVSTTRIIAETGSMTSDLAKGATAVSSVFKVLDRKSLIPGTYNVGENSKGEKWSRMVGEIELKKVDFAYPSRPEYLVLRQFYLKVKTGTSTGLVGRSGCGKSTVLGIIQRFYDVKSGAVMVDGVDLRELNLGWYRGNTALVSQEPVIYSGTIRDNIIFGKLEASESEVVEAAKAANAHDFISTLKDGYATECGERGAQLSGGQKQRIAIARAIIRNPIILLLDEATSALDMQSEHLVQVALERVMLGRTTLVVAHRLNIIKNVNSIAMVEEGRVVERGTFQELNRKGGAFFNLSVLQK